MPRNPNKIDYSGNFPKGFEIFSEISDPHGDGNTHHQSEGRAHGRVEKRQTVVCHRLDWMDSYIRAARKGLESIIMMERQSTTGDGKTRSQRSYYMSSLKKERSKEMQGYIRGHWGIENGCHWVLTPSFGRITTRLGNATPRRTSEPCPGSRSTP